MLTLLTLMMPSPSVAFKENGDVNGPSYVAPAPYLFSSGDWRRRHGIDLRSHSQRDGLDQPEHSGFDPHASTFRTRHRFRVRASVFYRSDFSHPISHRTPHYRVGNGGIRRRAICQKRPYFWMKRNCTIQDNIGGNGLGNRCFLTVRTVFGLSPALQLRTQCGHRVFSVSG